MRALVGGGLGEPVAEAARRRVDADLAAGLGVDERELADVGQLVLARVADLDREHRVARGDGRPAAAASRAARGSR